MQIGQNAVALLDAPVDEEKIEVFIEPESGADSVILRYSTWTEGLGWCSQKTIKINESQVDALQRALTVARHRVARKRAHDDSSPIASKVIKVPFRS